MAEPQPSSHDPTDEGENPAGSTEGETGSSSATASAPSSGGAAKLPEGAQEKKARGFMEEAEKKIKSSQTFFGGLFG